MRKTLATATLVLGAIAGGAAPAEAVCVHTHDGSVHVHSGGCHGTGELFDLINDVLLDHVDPAICSIAQGFAGTFGPIVVNDQGDVFIEGEPFWDCPPYDLFPPQ